jgi:uncharacterized membrane protein YuzA (DUF378 family)
MHALQWFGIGLMAWGSIGFTAIEFLTRMTITPADIVGYLLLSACCIWQAIVYSSSIEEEQWQS